MIDCLCQATEFRYFPNRFVGCFLLPDRIAQMEVVSFTQNFTGKSLSVVRGEPTLAKIKCKSYSYRNGVKLSAVQTHVGMSNCSFTECLFLLLADNTMAGVYVNQVGWILLCTTRDSYEIGNGTDANNRLCSQQFICWDNKIHWQAISTNIFSIEKSGTKWAIHDSFIDSIDLCEEGLFVSECICCRQEQEM